MKVKHLFVMSMLATVGCNPAQQHVSDSYDEYPVYKGDWEEMSYSPSATRFALWAPTAEAVNLLLYEAGQGGEAVRTLSMEAATDGMWNASVDGNLKGKFYTFNVKVDGEWLGDTPGVMAKAVGVNGDRAAVVDLRDTNPAGWEADVRPPLNSFADIVLYEMHHRDFSMDLNSGISHRGKFLALTETGTRSAAGDRTGIDHLKELGVTHVHILPSFDYSSVDESRPDSAQYNWGYDPKNYNVPEGSYSTDPYTPETRIREFKQMVMALHRAGIRVVMDVVYNHTAVTEGGNFERTVPGYFYRQTPEGTFANASACGNETASERPMVRKFIVESVKYWAEEYHVDGFRFDLMGIHDIATMKAVRQALDEVDPSIYIYGEGWAASAPQLPTDSLAMKANAWRMPGIAAFSDEFRDSLRGPFGHDEQGAFVIGRKGHKAGVRFGIAGGVEYAQVEEDPAHPAFWAGQPTQFISYVSCHDDLCLADRLKVTQPEASPERLKALQKLALTAVLTSQGVPFIFAGDEVMRDKQGVANSFRSPDSINTIRWQLKHDNRDLFDYVSGLIALRKAHPAFHFGDAEKVRSFLRFIPAADEEVVAFKLTGKPQGETWDEIIVVLNPLSKPTTVKVHQGDYRIACMDGRVSADPARPLATMTGGVLTVPACSALIAYR